MHIPQTHARLNPCFCVRGRAEPRAQLERSERNFSQSDLLNRSEAPAPTRIATLVLKETLFTSVAEDSRRGSEQGGSSTSLLAAAASAAAAAESAATDPNSWRRTLVSPLGTFLTGVRNK
jgi:hypothetical protein